jgi:hypothetical protein
MVSLTDIVAPFPHVNIKLTAKLRLCRADANEVSKCRTGCRQIGEADIPAVAILLPLIPQAQLQIFGSGRGDFRASMHG